MAVMSNEFDLPDESVDLNDPLTSLPDPHFAGRGHVPSSVDGFYFIDEKNPFLRGRESQAVDSALPAFPFDVNQVRRDFPILHQHVNGRPLVWLDNAATTQKPNAVIQRIAQYYQQ